MMRDTVFQVDMDDQNSKVGNLYYELPQGSVISLVNFNIYKADMPEPT